MDWLIALWHKYVASSAPWSRSAEIDGKLVISDFNASYAQKLRDELKDAVHGVMTDEDIVKLWTDRYNFERETPHLEIVHGEVNAEGRINVKLEWNDAFIRMLRDAGVEGESEDDMIRVYLASVTSKVDQDIADADDVDTSEPQHDSAIQGKRPARQPSDMEVEQLLEQMDPDVLKIFEKNIRRRAAKRRK